MPPSTSFAFLRMLGARAINHIVQAPIRSVYQKPLDASLLQGFSKTLLGTDLDGPKAAAQMLALAKQDGARYDANFYKAVRPMAEAALEAHLKAFGSDPSSWGPEALGAIYTGSQDPSAGGHAAFTVSIEPHGDPRGFLKDPNLVRHYLQAFPGLSAALTVPQYLQLLIGEYDVEGTPLDVYERLWPEITDYNRDLWLKGADVAGPHRLGANSTIVPMRATRLNFSDGDLLSYLMATALDHSQDGIVPWTFLRIEGFEAGVICVSIHLGDNPVWAGNAINVAIAPVLFKLIFRRGTIRGRLHEEMVARFGADRAAVGLLDPEVRTWFERRVRSIDWRISFDTSVLASMDSTGGELLRNRRMRVGGNTVATVEAKDMEAVQTPPDYDRVVSEGIARSKAEGYTGPPLVQGQDPKDVVVDPSAVASGVSVGPLDPRSLPLVPDLQPYGDKLADIAKGLDWSYLRSQVDADIASRVREKLALQPDPTAHGADELAKLLDTPEFRADVKSGLSDMVLTALAGVDGFNDIAEALGADGAEALSGVIVTAPLWDRMAQVSGGASFLDASVRTVVAEDLLHRLSEQKGNIEKRLAESASTLQRTQGEIGAKRQALEQVRRALAQKPDDPDLRREQKDLQAQLDALEAKERKAEEARKEAHDAETKNNEDAKDAQQEGQDASRERDARGPDVFHMEAAP